jgi:hypothetical protein
MGAAARAWPPRRLARPPDRAAPLDRPPPVARGAAAELQGRLDRPLRGFPGTGCRRRIGLRLADLPEPGQRRPLRRSRRSRGRTGRATPRGASASLVERAQEARVVQGRRLGLARSALPLVPSQRVRIVSRVLGGRTMGILRFGHAIAPELRANRGRTSGERHKATDRILPETARLANRGTSVPSPHAPNLQARTRRSACLANSFGSQVRHLLNKALGGSTRPNLPFLPGPRQGHLRCALFPECW